MSDVFKIRNQIEELCRKTDLDAEIVEHISRDITYCNYLYIVESFSEKVLTYDNFNPLSEIAYAGEKKRVDIITSQDGLSHEITSMDLVIVISRDGNDPKHLELVRNVKAHGGTVYLICSNPKSEMSLLCNEFIYLRNGDDFEDDVNMLFKTVIDRIFYFVESDEYMMEGPQPLNIMEVRRRANVPRVSNTQYQSPFLKQRNKEKTKFLDGLFSVKHIVLVVLLSIIISYPLALFLNMNKIHVFVVTAIIIYYIYVASLMHDSLKEK